MRLLVSMFPPENNLSFRLHTGAPIGLRWGAWVTDSHLLLRAGWKFHADESDDVLYRCRRIRLAVTSPDQYVVLSGTYTVGLSEIRSLTATYLNEWQGILDRPFELQQFTARDVFRTIDSDELKSWSRLEEVDPTIETFMRSKDFRMKDFKFLAPAIGKNNDIYIPPENVDELLNKILAIQYPQQQEIKKGLIMPEKKPIIQAKIYSLAV